MIKIRKIHVNDAEDFIALAGQIEAETDFMLRSAGERTSTVKEIQDIIKSMPLRGNFILVAEDEGRLVGYCGAQAYGKRKSHHCRELVIGIIQCYTGKGLGQKLLKKLEGWACQNKVHRLELKVLCHNERALGLYKKMGFEIEGTLRHVIFQNNQYYDEFQMAKLLS